MVNIFQIAVERLAELGFYSFLLPFILFTTLLYAVLKKTGILGESTIIHGVVSVSVGLLVFGAPVLVGVNLAQPLTAFLTQAAVMILVVVVSLLIASFFYPNIMEKMGDIFKLPGPASWILWIVIGGAAAAGLFATVSQPIKAAMENLHIPGEFVGLSVAIAVVFIIFLIVANMLGKEVK